MSCFVLLLFPRAVFLLGKEEMKLKALQMGMHTHVAACLSEEVRSKIDHCLAWNSENKVDGMSRLVLCHLCFYVTPWLGVPSQESLTHLHGGFDRGRTDQRLV